MLSRDAAPFIPSSFSVTSMTTQITPQSLQAATSPLKRVADCTPSMAGSYITTQFRDKRSSCPPESTSPSSNNPLKDLDTARTESLKLSIWDGRPARFINLKPLTPRPNAAVHHVIQKQPQYQPDGRRRHRKANSDHHHIIETASLLPSISLLRPPPSLDPSPHSSPPVTPIMTPPQGLNPFAETWRPTLNPTRFSLPLTPPPSPPSPLGDIWHILDSNPQIDLQPATERFDELTMPAEERVPRDDQPMYINRSLWDKWRLYQPSHISPNISSPPPPLLIRDPYRIQESNMEQILEQYYSTQLGQYTPYSQISECQYVIRPVVTIIPPPKRTYLGIFYPKSWCLPASTIFLDQPREFLGRLRAKTIESLPMKPSWSFLTNGRRIVSLGTKLDESYPRDRKLLDGFETKTYIAPEI